MKTEKRLTITYLFPGVFFSESSSEQVKTINIPTTIPADCYGFYFTETEYAIDGEKEFVGDSKRVGKMVVIGEKIHIDDIPEIYQGRPTDILKSNIRNSSPTKTAIKCQTGNWQMEDENTIVMSPSKFKIGKPMLYPNWDGKNKTAASKSKSEKPSLGKPSFVTEGAVRSSKKPKK